MHAYRARISWRRNGAFAGGRYSRGHEWTFDGGVTVPASASPSHVPAPYSVVEAVDPEEAVVAAASSCHMLFFLYFAAKRALVVESYEDDASCVMEANQDGKLAFTRITLRPQIRVAGTEPSAAALAAVHHAAHDEWYVANSLECADVVEPAGSRAEEA